MGDLKVEHWNESRDGPLNMLNMKKKLERLGYDCIEYKFPPGMHFGDHTHNISKKDAVVSGKMQIGMYGQEVILEAGDIIDIPKDTVHNATVMGNEMVEFYDTVPKT